MPRDSISPFFHFSGWHFQNLPSSAYVFMIKYFDYVFMISVFMIRV